MSHFRVQFIRLAFEPLGKAGEFELTTADRDSLSVLSEAWAKFNRGSGDEIAFSGPSASVGDLFAITKNGDTRFTEVWRIAPIGFDKLPHPCELRLEAR
jgi:hypothetical protein